MTEIEWWDYDDATEMADAVAGDVQFIIESAIDARGAAVIALPGGKTPLPIYDRLAKAKLDWKRVEALMQSQAPAQATEEEPASPGSPLRAATSPQELP